MVLQIRAKLEIPGGANVVSSSQSFPQFGYSMSLGSAKQQNSSETTNPDLTPDPKPNLTPNPNPYPKP